MHDQIVNWAREAHTAHWQMSGDEGTGDRLAKLVTDTRQARIQKVDSARFAVEVPVADHLRERIDVVDLVDGVAYELKVSPNNAHFEFYRDVFKVIVARDSRLPQLRRFVFLTPATAAAKLGKNLGGAVVKDSAKLGLAIEIVGF